MDSHEREARAKGYECIAGVDEAGRGPLAGPVVAVALVFPYPPFLNPNIKDSKKLSEKQRNRAVLDIYSSVLAVGVGIVWNLEIDALNVHRATLKAMAQAIDALNIQPDIVLVDGCFTTPSALPQKAIVSGDANSVTIAAASIVAKTARDAIMTAYHAIYPEYNFVKNKGYGTAAHLEALRKHGHCPIHRKTFAGVITG
ncbi:ribonuclease HII [bacterium]|nr:MAG: ribonuclease HII [bacterium]